MINMVVKIIPWLITKMKIRMNMVIIIIVVIMIIMVIMVIMVIMIIMVIRIIMVIMMQFMGRDDCSAFYFGRTSILCQNHPYPKSTSV